MHKHTHTQYANSLYPFGKTWDQRTYETPNWHHLNLALSDYCVRNIVSILVSICRLSSGNRNFSYYLYCSCLLGTERHSNKNMNFGVRHTWIWTLATLLISRVIAIFHICKRNWIHWWMLQDSFIFSILNKKVYIKPMYKLRLRDFYHYSRSDLISKITLYLDQDLSDFSAHVLGSSAIFLHQSHLR